MLPSGRLRFSILIRSALIGAFALAVIVLSAYPFDDAFIHLRLARNLAFAGQPYFNIGSPVMSGSSLLWMSWLAAGFHLLGHASIAFAVVTECLVIAALFVVTEGFLAVSGCRTWLTLTCAWCVCALALPAAGGLMETPLAVTLFFGGLWAFRARRLVAAGVLFGLSCATRFEMCVPALAALLLAPGFSGRTRFVAGAAPIALALAIALEHFFGVLIPHTMAAKAIVYQLRWADLLDSGPQEFGKPNGAVLVAILSMATAVGLFGLLQRGIRPLADSWRPAIVLVSLPLALVAIYLIQVPLIFPWYWTLSLCPMALFACMRLVEDFPSRSLTVNVATIAGLAVSLTLVVASAIAVVAATRGNLQRSPWLLENARTHTYLSIGRRLDEKCPASVVAAPEIGALGWSFEGRILDGDGLASPEVLPFHPLHVPDERPMGGVGGIPGRAVAALQPDLLVSMQLFSVDFTRKAATMPELSAYTVWWQEPVLTSDHDLNLPATLWGSRWTQVFSRHRSAEGIGCLD